ncbi:hypothetical protein UFOVP191_51 [uncultured Caudovirales phage]|uniref:Uncharacterized protein n=1 Tax=uncultured Caudovirales phage TaxID=2100421 RepID=A0A6J7WL30_9CAUD|nr:hypothetical protein UFOVP191_51 [uncultured Caudovirales phage]
MQVAEQHRATSSPARPKATVASWKLRIRDEILYDVEFYGWSATEAAKHLGLHQSQYSNLVNLEKHMHRFSIDNLLGIMFEKLGHNFELAM